VGADVRRIEGVVTRLQELSELTHAKREPVDIASLLTELLEERREVIEARRLLVLKELEPTHASVLGDAPLLRNAFGGIFNRALEWVPERGGLYIALRHRPERAGEGASIRVLLRFQGASSGGPIVPANDAPTLAESTLEFVAAQAVILALGGAFQFDVGDRETVLMVDLPAPPGAVPVA
jgi:signal transduction histidine kinase